MLPPVPRCSAALLIAAALVVPSLAAAAPTWVGDFETGDLGQWTLSSQVIGNAEHMTVTTSPVYEGSYAGRIQLDPQDVSPSGHNRNELVYVPEPSSFEGSERWYSIAVQPGEVWADSWHLVFYWEGNPVYASVMSMVAVGPQLQFRTFVGAETLHWSGPFAPGTWQEFVLHVQWSPDPAVGFVELYLDGVPVVPLTHVATMHGPGVPNELHAGMLRDDAIDLSEVLFLDGVRDGATMEDVVLEPSGGSEEGGDGSTGDEPTDGGGEGTGSSAGAGTSDGGVDGTDGGSGASEGGSADAGASDGDGGCGCRSTPDPGPPGGLGLLGLAALTRRRRRAVARR
ncbi:MAG: polysaccharide lyase [Myxococcales bacterium]|nr:polysaccharide lyase [Myxococcales bacterium]